MKNSYPLDTEIIDALARAAGIRGDWSSVALSDAMRTRIREALRAPREPDPFPAHIARQRAFSLETFGPGERTEALSNHIRKELDEVAAEPTAEGRAAEAVDVIILAMELAIRAIEEAGGDAVHVLPMMIREKQRTNERRTWSDWRTHDPDTPNEHDRTGE